MTAPRPSGRGAVTATKVGTPEVSSLQIGAKQIGSGEIGASEICAFQANASKVGRPKVSIKEIGSGQIGTSAAIPRNSLFVIGENAFDLVNVHSRISEVRGCT